MALEAVQAQAGHASIETTRIYLHLADDWLAEYARALAAIDAQTIGSTAVTALPTDRREGQCGRGLRADLHAAGLQVDHSWLWGGRAFLHRYGGGASAGTSAPLAERLGCNVKIHRFVIWLLATGRMTTTADYLLARRNRLRRGAGPPHPRLPRAVRRRHRTWELGFVIRVHHPAVEGAWHGSAPCTGCRPTSSPTGDLDAEPGPSSMPLPTGSAESVCKELRSGMFGLEATLFHARHHRSAAPQAVQRPVLAAGRPVGHDSLRRWPRPCTATSSRSP
jgi:hypothetical protein